MGSSLPPGVQRPRCNRTSPGSGAPCPPGGRRFRGSSTPVELALAGVVVPDQVIPADRFAQGLQQPGSRPRLRCALRLPRPSVPAPGRRRPTGCLPRPSPRRPECSLGRTAQRLTAAGRALKWPTEAKPGMVRFGPLRPVRIRIAGSVPAPASSSRTRASAAVRASCSAILASRLAADWTSAAMRASRSAMRASASSLWVSR